MEIFDGDLAPGDRLCEAEFAERLGIARHSFRAATQVLISEGMLRRNPHRGVQVTLLDAADIADIVRLRAALETEAVRLVIAAGSVPEGARQAVEDLSAVADGAPWREVVEEFSLWSGEAEPRARPGRVPARRARRRCCAGSACGRRGRRRRASP